MSNQGDRVPRGALIPEHRNWITFRSMENAEHWLDRRFDNDFEIIFCARCNHWHGVRKPKKVGRLKKPVCRKIKHPTKRAAEIHADDINRKERATNVVPYKCYICGYWHVGNRKESK